MRHFTPLHDEASFRAAFKALTTEAGRKLLCRRYICDEIRRQGYRVSHIMTKELNAGVEQVYISELEALTHV